MTEDDLEIIRAEIARAVKETVNGKIDSIARKLEEHNAKHEADMEDMKPYMQAAAGGKLLYGVFKVLVAVAIGWVSIKSAFPTFSVHF